jgi:endonuclease YncB( thermonuclease family)
MVMPSFAAQFKVIRVYDGDTLKAKSISREITIRLVGIDAPESSRKKHQPGQPYSRKAREYLNALVLNKMIDIRYYGSDLYKRILAEIIVKGVNINLAMVKAGLAEVYRGPQASGFDVRPYNKAEYEARSARRGMWSQGDAYVSPRDWRKRQKDN